MIKDCKSGREIDIRESFLIVRGRVYAKESYVVFDTSKIKAYPPLVYYDREEAEREKEVVDDMGALAML